MDLNHAAQRRSLIIIWITIFIDLMGVTLIIPFVNDFVAELGGDEQSVGLLLGSYAFMQLLFAPVWGRISDRIGRRPVIIIGLFTSAVGFAIFGLADRLWLLFDSRMLAGLANANISTAQAYVADITVPEERAGRMGLVGAAFNLGFIVGFPIGGILSSALGNQAPVLFAAALSLVNGLAALVILPESYPREVRPSVEEAMSVHPWVVARITMRNLRRFWKRPTLTRIFSAFFIYSVAFSIIHVTFVEYFRDVLELTPAERGFVFMFLGVVGAITQGTVVKWLVRRIGESRVIELGLVIAAVGLGLIPFLRTVALLYVGTFLIGFGNSLIIPSVMAAISVRSKEHEQGIAMGVTQSLGSLARIIGPPYGGFTYAQINLYFPFISAGAAALGALGIYASRPRSSPAEKAATSIAEETM
ncbi:MAG: MFS transporter [Fidelibacterota bacterium]|nr:MAG: MFS transporter [Candidatus Neomarinimicrobiota bacterium]